jgi:hypothetical protein
MTVQIGGRPETLYQRDSTGLCLGAFLKPACLIRKVEMVRLTTPKTGESRWG